MLAEDVDNKVIISRASTLLRGQATWCYETSKKIAACTAGTLLKKSHVSFEDKPLVFTHSPIKVWQALLALLSPTLPWPADLISEAF